MIGSAPKRIFPSQTGNGNFKSSQIMKKNYREESQNEVHPSNSYQSDAQWESTLDNLGGQHRMGDEKAV